MYYIMHLPPITPPLAFPLLLLTIGSVYCKNLVSGICGGCQPIALSITAIVTTGKYLLFSSVIIIEYLIKVTHITFFFYILWHQNILRKKYLRQKITNLHFFPDSFVAWLMLIGLVLWWVRFISIGIWYFPNLIFLCHIMHLMAGRYTCDNCSSDC